MPTAQTATNGKNHQAAPLPLFERQEGAVVLRAQPEGNNRLKGFRDAFDEAQKSYDRGASANGKARERVKQLAEDSGISKKAIGGLRQLQRMDPREAVAYLNDLLLLAAEYGIFDAAEEAAQAERREADSASVEAAEASRGRGRGSKKAEARVDGEPPKGIMAACFAQGEQAYDDNASIDDCPAEYETGKRAWWREGFLRKVDAERKPKATSSSGKLN